MKSSVRRRCVWWMPMALATQQQQQLRGMVTALLQPASRTGSGGATRRMGRLTLAKTANAVTAPRWVEDDGTAAAASGGDDTGPQTKKRRPQTSAVAAWHKQRRREMLQKYGDKIAPLERDASSGAVGLPLLIVTCASLLALAVLSASLPVLSVVVLAAVPGSVLSLWQLQILHDVIHGSLLPKGQATVWGLPRKDLQEKLLFWGSMPSIFGYYLYLKSGHLSHHSNTGDFSLADLFDSDQHDFEDGDVLFVAHRMHVKGDYGPKLRLFGKELKISISKSGFYFWKEHEAVLNALRFTASFLYERLLLSFNDVLVALLGKNLFFVNKPESFHRDCTRYARCSVALRGVLLFTVGWRALLFLYLSESLWSLPPHPASAMFVSNHGSKVGTVGGCIPTSSTYAGHWYSLMTLGTNFHCEHHDFPTIPFTRLHELRKIAPEYYRASDSDNLMEILGLTFRHPEFYACMDATKIADTLEERTNRAE